VNRLEAAGARVVCGERVERIECRGGRAVAARTAEARYEARRAIVADIGAPQLYADLLAGEPLPRRVLEEIDAFQYDNGTVKVDWTLDGPIPWRAERARAAGTVHVAEGMDALTVQASELACGLTPATPYLVLGQYGHFDASRAPADKDTAWAYRTSRSGSPATGAASSPAAGTTARPPCSRIAWRSRWKRSRPVSGR
jgi:phytoene dehydrogenase-like protein